MAMTTIPENLPSTRKEARNCGERFFFNGGVCKNSHISHRYAGNGLCVQCEVERSRRDCEIRFPKKGPRIRRLSTLSADELRAYNKAKNKRKREKYREKRTITQRAYYKRNAEFHREYKRRYARENPEAIKAARATRRARETAAGGSFTKQELKDLYLKQKGKCTGCFVKLGQKYHADHIHPICLGGTSFISNIQLLCPPCNHRKHSKRPEVWAMGLGRLL
jgi:5-methylcytosine-specific restriction endonuclease McrA